MTRPTRPVAPATMTRIMASHYTRGSARSGAPLLVRMVARRPVASPRSIARPLASRSTWADRRWLAAGARSRSRRHCRRRCSRRGPRSRSTAPRSPPPLRPPRSPPSQPPPRPPRPVATAPLVEGRRPRRRHRVAVARVLLTASLFAALGRLEQRSAREVDAALAVDLGDQHLDLVADVDHVLDGRHAVVRPAPRCGPGLPCPAGSRRRRRTA